MSSSKFSTFDPSLKIWRGPTRPSIFNTEVSLGFIILYVLKQNPDRVMQICDDSGAEMTCGEMHSRTVKIASFLTSKTELKQGDVVGIIARNSENVAPVAFACFTLGLPINPLAPVFGVNEIVEMYLKTRPKAIFCDFDMVEKVLEAVKKIELEECKIFTLMEKVEGFEFVDEIVKGLEEDFEPPILPNIASTPLALICSSGTSGPTKCVVRSHKNWISHPSIRATAPFGVDAAIFIPTTLYWMTGVHVLVSSALFQLKRIITSENMTPKLFMEILKRRKVTSTFVAPFISKELIKSGLQITFESVKSVLVSGASILNVPFEGIQEFFPNATINTCYASTEGDIMTFAEYNGTASSGQVLPNFQLKIIDENGNSLGPNEQGQICFKTSMMFDGYFNDPEATKSAFDGDGWCYTGDVGYFDDEGFIFVIDRLKHMLKYNRIQIAPQEIESVINEIDGVIASCVVGVFDWGNDIIFAFVIKDEKKVELNEKFIENYVNERVMNVKRIRGGVHFVKEFPLTATGKVKNRELREVAKKMYNK